MLQLEVKSEYLVQNTARAFCVLLKMDQEKNANPRGVLCNQLNKAWSTHVLKGNVSPQKAHVVFGELKTFIYREVHF